MDNEKLFKYAGYAGLGIFGTMICLILVAFLPGEELVPFNEARLKPLMLISGSLGGILGGVISKKFRWAFVGGFILFGLIVLIGFLLLIWQ